MTESRKNSRKLADVTPSDKTPPTVSSRPLIVSNRTIADPMVTADRSPATPVASSTLSDRPRATIQPISTPSKSREVEATAGDSAAKAAKNDVPPKESPTAPDKTEAETAPTTELPRPEPESNDRTDDSMSTKEPTSPQPATDEKTPSLVSKLDDKKQPAAATTPEDEAEAKKTAEAERAEHLEELIENKTYFLPISQDSTRTSWVLLLLFLALVVAGAIGYMMTMAP